MNKDYKYTQIILLSELQCHIISCTCIHKTVTETNTMIILGVPKVINNTLVPNIIHKSQQETLGHEMSVCKPKWLKPLRQQLKWQQSSVGLSQNVSDRPHTYSTCQILCVLNPFTILCHWHFCLFCTYIRCNYTQDTGLSPAKWPQFLLAPNVSTELFTDLLHSQDQNWRPPSVKAKVWLKKTLMWVNRSCYNTSILV